MKQVTKMTASLLLGMGLIFGATQYGTADQNKIMADAPNLAKLTGTYQIDPSHAHAGFSVSHKGLSFQNGQFDTMSGTIKLDSAEPAKSSVRVNIEAASIDSGWDKRDAHLRNPDFFNVKKFPTLSFVSTKVVPTGKSTAKVTGNLTLLGVSKPVTLDIRFNKGAKHKGKFLIGFSGTTTIKRSDWGMTKYIPFIGDEVKIRLEIEASRSLPQST